MNKEIVGADEASDSDFHWDRFLPTEARQAIESVMESVTVRFRETGLRYVWSSGF